MRALAQRARWRQVFCRFAGSAARPLGVDVAASGVPRRPGEGCIIRVRRFRAGEAGTSRRVVGSVVRPFGVDVTASGAPHV